MLFYRFHEFSVYLTVVLGLQTPSSLRWFLVVVSVFFRGYSITSELPKNTKTSVPGIVGGHLRTILWTSEDNSQVDLRTVLSSKVNSQRYLWLSNKEIQSTVLSWSQTIPLSTEHGSEITIIEEIHESGKKRCKMQKNRNHLTTSDCTTNYEQSITNMTIVRLQKI